MSKKQRYCWVCGEDMGFVEDQDTTTAAIPAESMHANVRRGRRHAKSVRKRTAIWMTGWGGDDVDHRGGRAAGGDGDDAIPRDRAVGTVTMADDMQLPEMNKEEYLGDGLYVSFDGWGIRLRAPRENGDHFIVLDPDTWGPLRAWIDRYPPIKKHLESKP